MKLSILKYCSIILNQFSAQRLVGILFMTEFIMVSIFEAGLGFAGREWMIIGLVGFGYAISTISTTTVYEKRRADD